MCKPHLFWGVSDRNLAFSKPLSPWVVAITLDWNAFLSRGGLKSTRACFAVGVFKAPFPGRCTACLSPLQSQISCVYEPDCFPQVTQFLWSLQWAPSHTIGARGEEVWPHAEWSKLPTLGLELLELQTICIIHGKPAFPQGPFCQQQWGSINCTGYTPCWDSY